MTDLEILRLMKDGGLQICEQAKEKWTSGKYGRDAEMGDGWIYRHLEEWDDKARRISSLYDRLKRSGALTEEK